MSLYNSKNIPCISHNYNLQLQSYLQKEWETSFFSGEMNQGIAIKSVYQV